MRKWNLMRWTAKAAMIFWVTVSPLRADEYFVERGYLYRKDAAHAASYVKDSKGIVEVLRYRGQVICLFDSGKIFAYVEDAGGGGTWIELTNNVHQMFLAGDELIALDFDGQLYVYQGNPAAVEYYTVFVNGNVILNSHRGLSFEASGVGEVKRVRIVDERPKILFREGNEVDFSELKISSADRDLEYQFTFDVTRRGYFVTFENGTEYRVLKVWLKKSRGELFATLQYQVDTWASYNSSRFRLPAGQIPARFPKLLAGGLPDDETFSQIFDEIFTRYGTDSWKIVATRFH